MSPEIHSSVINHKNARSAKMIWSDLQEYFLETTTTNRAIVCKRFLHTRLEKGKINQFILNIKVAVENLYHIGIEMPEEILAHLVLDKLPESMNEIGTSITQGKEVMNIKTVITHLETFQDMENLKENKGKESNPPVSLYTSKIKTLVKQCKKEKHSSDSFNEDSSQSKVHISTFLSSLDTNQQSLSSSFVLDSGATSHMVSNKDLFINLNSTERGVIKTGSGKEALHIEGKGKICLQTNQGRFFLFNFLYVPDLVVNLLSVRCLVLDDYDVRFDKDSFSVGKMNDTVIKGKYGNNLPMFNLKEDQGLTFLTYDETLHKSLGHVSYRRIQDKLGVPIKADRVCEACTVSKITKASFKNKHVKAGRPFEELHLDLIGPISPSSYSGHQYLITIVDSHSRYCSSIPVKLKSEVAETISSSVQL